MLAAALAFILLIPGLPARAAELADAAAVPHLDTRGQAAYRQFLAAPPHRAFAIAPGGGWGWSADAVTPDMALRQALDTCGRHTRQACVPYAADKRVVFDARVWPTLWRPYAGAAEAARAPTGTARGERFPRPAPARAGRQALETLGAARQGGGTAFLGLVVSDLRA
jgi:hypothetical protein